MCFTNPKDLLVGNAANFVIEKGKGFPYLLPSAGPEADPSVQSVNLHVTISHPPGGRLPLLSAKLAVTFTATEHHRPLAGNKLYCLVTETQGVNNLPKVVGVTAKKLDELKRNKC